MGLRYVSHCVPPENYFRYFPRYRSGVFCVRISRPHSERRDEYFNYHGRIGACAGMLVHEYFIAERLTALKNIHMMPNNYLSIMTNFYILGALLLIAGALLVIATVKDRQHR